MDCKGSCLSWMCKAIPDGFIHPAETEATCIWKVSLQIVVEISKSLCYECQVRSIFFVRELEYDSLAGQTLQQDYSIM